VWVLLELMTRKIKLKCIKINVLGTLPLWNGKDPDPYQIERQDPDTCQCERQDPDPYPYQKGLDPQKVRCIIWLDYTVPLSCWRCNCGQCMWDILARWPVCALTQISIRSFQYFSIHISLQWVWYCMPSQKNEDNQHTKMCSV
jgi:hypothetical protein